MPKNKMIILSNLKIDYDAKISLADEEKGFDWYPCVPTGYFGDHPDGAFKIDEDDLNKIVSDFNHRNVEIVVDYHHQTVEAASKGIKAPAAGWVKMLKKAYVNERFFIAVGIEWLEDAKKHIEKREFKYLSPVLIFEGGVNIWLHSIALLNDPFFSQSELTEAKLNSLLGKENEENPSANNAENQEEEAQMTKEEIEAIVKATMQEGQTDLDSKIATGVAEIMKNSRATIENAEAEINKLIEEGKILPTQKDSYMKACSANPNLIDDFKNLPVINTLVGNTDLKGKGDLKVYTRAVLKDLDTQEKLDFVNAHPEIFNN